MYYIEISSFLSTDRKGNKLVHVLNKNDNYI